MSEEKITHPQLVTALIKSGEEIANNMTAIEADLIHSIMGVAGEVGELLDAVKKHVIYKKELDQKNVIEELGDIEFYLERLRQILNVTREETLEGNIAKLSVRYAGLSYSNEAAIGRRDKSPE